MINDQVVAGLIEVHGPVTRDEEFTMGIHEAVDENAVGLEQVIHLEVGKPRAADGRDGHHR